MTRELTFRRTFFRRFGERARYGLMIQELLDRIAGFGLVAYPYYVVVEEAGDPKGLTEARPLEEVRLLSAREMNTISEMPCRPQARERLISLLQTNICFGIFSGEELAGYTWANLQACPVPRGGDALFALSDSEAYLFGAYVARPFRGKRLAPLLRHNVHRRLAEMGKTRCYSLTLAGNKSSRKFKQWQGARETELRLLLRVGNGPGVDVRLKGQKGEVKTPWLKILR